MHPGAAVCHKVVLSTQLPPTREQLLHLGLGKTVVNQKQRALIVLGANHPPGSLYHFLQPRIQVGVVILSSSIF